MPIIREGETIQIFIERQATETEDPNGGVAATNSKGIYHRREDEDYTPRRLKSDVKLTLFDGGAVRTGTPENGEWRDRMFTVPKHGDEPAPFSLADLEDFEADLFSVPVADWGTYFQPLEYGYAHELGLIYYNSDTNFGRLSPENEKWKPDGLKAKGKLRINSQAFVGFDLFDAEKTKTTKEPDVDAPAVDFAFTKNAQIYLIPSIHYRLAIAQASPLDRRLYAGYGIATRFLRNPRQVLDFGANFPLYEQSLFEFGVGYQVFQTLSDYYGYSFPEDDRNIKRYMSEIFASQLGAILLDFPGSTVINPVSDPRGFPFPEPVSGYYQFVNIGVSSGLHSFTRKMLAAVVLMGGEYFYIWRELSPLYSGTMDFRFLFAS